MSVRGQTAIVGFCEIPTQRDYGDRSTASIMAEVALGAIRDAGLRKDDIDGLINAEGVNSLTLAQHLEMKPRYTASMTTHGASGCSAIVTAAGAITMGLANYGLCIFGESRPRSSSRPAGATAPRGGGGPARVMTTLVLGSSATL